jgi:hypothetical protein
MKSLLAFVLGFLSLTISASSIPPPDPEPTCTVSQAPAYGGIYLIFLESSLTPSYASTITPETQESAARQVAKDLYIDNEVTQYAFLDSMTMISAHVTWIKACDISKDPRVCDCRTNDVYMLISRFRLRVLRRMGLLIQGFDILGMEGKQHACIKYSALGQHITQQYQASYTLQPQSSALPAYIS